MKPQKKNFTTEHTEKKIFKFKHSVNSVVSFNSLIFINGLKIITILFIKSHLTSLCQREARGVFIIKFENGRF
jgi:hypothetical protein